MTPSSHFREYGKGGNICNDAPALDMSITLYEVTPKLLLLSKEKNNTRKIKKCYISFYKGKEQASYTKDKREYFK